MPGAVIWQEPSVVEAEAPPRMALEGAEVAFDRITVTGTEDLLMAAVLARGETKTDLANAAREPEAWTWQNPTRLGANIQGAGTSVIRVQGVAKLHGAAHTIIADRIETGTFLIAGAMTHGNLLLTGCEPEHLRAFIAKPTARAREIQQPAHPDRWGSVWWEKRGSVDVTTEEHPGFATDLQAQFMALMTQAEGIAIITETIFENRFMHAQ